MSANMRKVSVVFPTLNEERNIRRTISKAMKFLNKRFRWWEILVIDNASTDKTLQIVGDIKKKEKRIRLIKHPKNLGYAKSTSDGLHYSKGDVIFIIDSDGQHEISDIIRFLAKIDSGV